MMIKRSCLIFRGSINNYCSSSQKYPASCKVVSTERGQRSTDSMRRILSLSSRSTFQRLIPCKLLICGVKAVICFLKRRLVLNTSTSITYRAVLKIGFIGCVRFIGSEIFFIKAAAPASTTVLPFIFELLLFFGGHLFPFSQHLLPEAVFKLFPFMVKATKAAE